MDGTPGRTMRRRGRWAAILMIAGAVALTLPSCGGDSSDTGPIIALGVTISPDPSTSTASTLEGFDWVVPYTVTLTETGGLGGTLTNVNIFVYEAVDGAQGDEGLVSNTLDSEDSRLDARGSLDVALTTNYALPSGGKPAFMDVFVSVRDDDGFTIQAGARLTVE